MLRLRSTTVGGFLVLLVAAVCAVDQALEDEEIGAEDYMEALNFEINRQSNIVAETSWAYASNITDYNEKLKNDAAAANAVFTKVRERIV